MDNNICPTALLQVGPHLDIDWDSMSYRPVIFFNEFWQLREILVPVNETLKEQTVALDLAQMGLWKFTIFQQVEKSFEMQVGACPCPCVLHLPEEPLLLHANSGCAASSLCMLSSGRSRCKLMRVLRARSCLLH
jgi:hypothetical protein